MTLDDQDVELQEFELNIGDCLEIDGYRVTVVDIEDGEVTFRLDDSADNPRRADVSVRPR